MFQTLEEIKKNNGDQISKAMEFGLIKVNNIDKAVLVLDKLHSIEATKPHIAAKCKHLEAFIKTYKS